jgi:hypothetical protein
MKLPSVIVHENLFGGSRVDAFEQKVKSNIRISEYYIAKAPKIEVNEVLLIDTLYNILHLSSALCDLEGVTMSIILNNYSFIFQTSGICRFC